MAGTRISPTGRNERIASSLNFEAEFSALAAAQRATRSNILSFVFVFALLTIFGASGAIGTHIGSDLSL